MIYNVVSFLGNGFKQSLFHGLSSSFFEVMRALKIVEISWQERAVNEKIMPVSLKHNASLTKCYHRNVFKLQLLSKHKAKSTHRNSSRTKTWWCLFSEVIPVSMLLFVLLRFTGRVSHFWEKCQIMSMPPNMPNGQYHYMLICWDILITV